MRKITKEEFIKRAIELHGNKYNYDNIIFSNMHSHIKILCNTCDTIFTQTPTGHLNCVTACPKCCGQYSPTTEEFIEKLKGIYGDNYNYDNVRYIKNSIKVKLHCNIHNFDFEQSPWHLLCGYGCRKCGQNYTLTVKEFIEKAIEIHEDKYDYSIVDFKYTTQDKVKIRCKIHDFIFEQTPLAHLQCKIGCPKCAKNNMSNTEEFIEKAKKIHGDRYDYSLVDYRRAYIKVIIVCKEHGEFNQSPTKHLSGRNCPYCKQTYGENAVGKWLKSNNIKFISEKKFKDCKDIRPLNFDFYLIDKNICIEYDGEQHYKLVNFTSKLSQEIMESNLKKCKIRDEIKNEYCKNNNIKLIRIPYWEFKNISLILEKELLSVN